MYSSQEIQRRRHLPCHVKPVSVPQVYPLCVISSTDVCARRCQHHPEEVAASPSRSRSSQLLASAYLVDCQPHDRRRAQCLRVALNPRCFLPDKTRARLSRRACHLRLNVRHRVYCGYPRHRYVHR